MKLVFLDIDGVLNDFEQSWGAVPDYNPEFVPRCVQNFNRIIRETEASIVISSSWRGLIHTGQMTLNGFRVLLRTHAIHGYVVGYTREESAGVDCEPRWAQIADWLKKPCGDLERYCILDDCADAFGGRPGVQTNGAVGLTESDADAAIAILTHPAEAK